MDIDSVLRFIDIVGIEDTAKFIVNLQNTIDALTKNNEELVEKLRQLLQ